MAKKKPSNLTHFIHYDKRTGRILSVGNETDPRFDYCLNVTFLEAEPFLTGKWSFNDYLVGYKKDADGKSSLGIVQNTDQGYAFKNNVFEWITETAKTPECLVTWNKPNGSWDFSVDKSKSYDSVIAPKLVFFVTLENDFDFLIRTIFISLQDLISSDSISVPFESNIENKIDKISISSKLVFKSYGLKVIHD